MKFAPFVLTLATSLAFAQAPQGVPENASQKVSEHVWAIMGFPNVAIVVGGDSALVVDSGMGERNGAVIVREVKKLAPGKKLYLTTTHFHPEHATGDQAFPAGTILIRNEIQQEEMEEHGKEYIDMFSSRSAANKELLANVKLRKPDMIYSREQTLDLGGGVRARLIYTGFPAHTRGDEVIHVLPDRTLIPGDLVQNKLVPNLPNSDANFGGWLKALDVIADLRPVYVVPDHGELGDGSLIAQQKSFMVDLRDTALGLKKQGMSADDAGKKIQADFKVKYPGWTNLGPIPGAVRRIFAEMGAEAEADAQK
jgi:glyoxylase-like metal-dependent hydrolase (beta-lactamase superfamily II)